ARNIRVVEPRQDCCELVRADRTRLKQVLLNLLSNAVKYNREQGSVSIACVTTGTSLQIRINDTGMGISAAQQARLFMAFERLDADQTRVDGTGI
ncbi:MAG: ATP-binding protein, partial [Pseudomonadota bacterium]